MWSILSKRKLFLKRRVDVEPYDVKKEVGEIPNLFSAEKKTVDILDTKEEIKQKSKSSQPDFPRFSKDPQGGLD